MELAERWTRLYHYPQICIHIYPRGRPGYIMKTTQIDMYRYIPERSTRFSCFKPSRAIGKLVSLLWSKWISLEDNWYNWWCTWMVQLVVHLMVYLDEYYLRFFNCCSDMGMDWMRLNERFTFSSLVSLPVSWKMGSTYSFGNLEQSLFWVAFVTQVSSDSLSPVVYCPAGSLTWWGFSAS